VLLASALSARAHAQGPRVILPDPVSLPVMQPSTISLDRATVGVIGSSANDYRYTGMYIGLGTAAFVGVLGTIMCTNQDTPCNAGDLALGITAFAAIAGTIGAMIGRAFPKDLAPATAAP
jgi:hypothetical protein